MTIASLFDKIAGRQKQREQSRADDYLGLVKTIAAGKEPDADRVDTVLAATGWIWRTVRPWPTRSESRSTGW